ncbi:peptidase S1 [Noviherbaspirillum cavernae]|uniref:Peptidase S1 n=1 Tax=Noviherbaspirillum cavernae TaxID=2320862 RepID=A0A418X4M4_9BURK|nr:trypsin-like peptidase domain-containing protein [Noviherbaspirillum cavernae]RJG07390.1 peptidase S1 [Noviherbaspirillum cavernae]
MKKVTLYSKSAHSRAQPDAPAKETPAQSGGSGRAHAGATSVASPSVAARPSRLRRFISRHERLLLVLSSVLLSLLLFSAWNASQAPARKITQKDIDAAVLHTLDKNVLPSPETKAYDAIRPSVVRVRQLGKMPEKDAEVVRGVGTGVVVVDKGVILTNLHVVAGADRVQVVFSNGLVSEANVVGLQPENDLAVLQAKTIPDDLIPATLKSTGDLALGEKVIAVGFPFGIGPSVSSGVISGLTREYQSPEGQRLLTNLIQFDAAANPGNSGGPLVTMDGSVVGIVTAILNPTTEDFFIGIGFAVPIENAASAVGTSPF